MERAHRNSRRRLGLAALPLAVASVVAAIAAGLVTGSGQAASAVAPTNTALPTISGTPQVGQVLTAGDGTWSNSPTSYAYQWLRCNADGKACQDVRDATVKTYTLAGADAKHAMRVGVTARNADGSASAQSAQTAVVTDVPAPAGAVPANTSAPTITGLAKVGRTLTGGEGTWSGKPTGYTYAWQRCDADVASCATISKATGKTYIVVQAVLGYRLRLVVTARNAKGSASANSAITAIVQPLVRITNKRPTLAILSIRFRSATVYARFRICDDSYKNLTVLATDSRLGVRPQTRRFTTLAAPRPCGAYTRHWTLAPRFRGPGKYTVTLRATDKSGRTSLPARRTFTR